MQKIIIFFIGAVVGVLASYVYFSPTLEHETPTSDDLKNRSQVKTVLREDGTPSSTVAPLAITNPELLSGTPPPQAIEAQAQHLIKTFHLQTENLYSSNEFKDLEYLLRHNKSVAEQVKNRILESDSYNERMSLVAVLAGDKSDDTMDFATFLIESTENETQNLGFELLFSLGEKSNTPKLNATLLEAASYETNPETLSNIINVLSVGKLDEPTKAKANESFQRLISRGESSIVTARAIDGLSRLGDQDAIYLAVVDHLIDADPDVKTAAISAINSLDKNKINQEMIETLKHIANNTQEPSIVREYATMILDGL